MTMLNLRKNFCVLIISYGRADNCKTVQMLLNSGYSGPWFIVCSTDDKDLPKYKTKYGEKIIVFSKDDIGKTFDRMDNLTDTGLGVYARQACFPIAAQLGYKYFLSLDDDYNLIEWRYVNKNKTKLCSRTCRHLDEIFEAMLRFLDSHPQLWEIDFSTCGDFIGGKDNCSIYKDLKRKATNSHFNDVDKHIRYHGAMNDDVNACINGWRVGKMFFSTPLLSVQMTLSQKGGGGMVDAYIDAGALRKAFYPVMLAPSIAKITLTGNTIHHIVHYNKIGPKILRNK